MPVFIITVKYRLQRKPIVRVYVDNNMQIRTFKARHNLKIIYRINRQARKNNLKRITFDGCSKNEQDGWLWQFAMEKLSVPVRFEGEAAYE